VSEAEGQPPPLPRRPPRSLFVHFAIDTAVAFLLSILIFLMFSLPLWIAVLFAAGVGIGAAPYTRRAEIAGLAKRPEGPEAG
jgi:hypothetical protein